MDQRTIDALRKKGLLPPATDEEKKMESARRRDESADVIRARAEYTEKMNAAIA